MRNYSDVLKAIEGVDYVYHLAGMVSIGSGNKEELYSVNVGGTENVVRSCLKRSVKRLIYTSSIHAFPEPPPGEVITKKKELEVEKIVGSYGKSKAKATEIVLDAFEKGLESVIVHPTGVVGPYDYQGSNMGQLISDFLRRRLYAYIDGEYDFVDVRDVAEGLILAKEKGRPGENYILSGEEISVKEILNHLEDVTGLPAPRVKIPLWFARLTAPLSELYYKLLGQKPLFTSYSIYTLTSNSTTSSEKAKKELGFSSRPIKRTLKDTVEWLLSREDKGHQR